MLLRRRVEKGIYAMQDKASKIYATLNENISGMQTFLTLTLFH